MKKIELKKIAIKKIEEGMSRQDVLVALKEETHSTYSEIGQVLKNIPPKQTREKYKFLNGILLSLLILTVLAKIIAGLPLVLEKGIMWSPFLFLLIAVDIFIVYGVFKYDGSVYKWVSIVPILSFLRSITTYTNGELDTYRFIDLLLYGLLVFLGFFLKSKFSSNYETKREYYLNESGENRGRDIIYFKD